MARDEPLLNTYAEAEMAKARRQVINKNVSLLFAVTRSEEKRIVRINLPWLVSKPVRSTYARQPPSGAARVNENLSTRYKADTYREGERRELEGRSVRL